MADFPVQVGIDIATSLSIFIAMITYIISEKKSRRQNESQFAVGNLRSLLDQLNKSSNKYDQINQSLRRATDALSEVPPQDLEAAKIKLLNSHILEVIFFIEDTSHNLDAQQKIYIPVFLPVDVGKDLLTDKINRFQTILDGLKSSDYSRAATALTLIEPVISETESLIVNTLSSLIKRN